MSESACRAGVVRSLGRELVDPDISPEELGRAVLVLERLVLSGAVDEDAAEALLDERIFAVVR